MLLVGKDLYNIVINNNIIDDNNIEETCISLSLGNTSIELNSFDEHVVLTYGEKIPDKYITCKQIDDQGIVLKPLTSMLCTSMERINLPLGYFGLLQTKGSLARFMVSLHFSDGQIDPGFRGNVTFEIFNGSNFYINIKKGQKVGNLYIFNTSTTIAEPYRGRYCDSNIPTVFRPLTGE